MNQLGPQKANTRETNSYSLSNLNDVEVYPGILRDKTMADKSIYIANDDYQTFYFCSIKSLVVKLGHCNQNSIKVWANE